VEPRIFGFLEAKKGDVEDYLKKTYENIRKL